MRVFVGSDERGGRGEIVLDHGIKKFCPDAKVVMMRPGGEGGHWEMADWNMGRSHYRPYSGEGWATNFTCFRWTIPEAAGFQGRAVYCDADQTIHGKVSDLANCDLQGKCCAIRKGVIVFDCGHPFWQSPQWPRLVDMKTSGASLGVYQQLVNRHGGGSSLFGVEWDVLDGKEMSVWDAKLNHYTAMQWQPYHPFPDRFAYPIRHPRPEVDEVFWQAYGDALASLKGVERPKYGRFCNVLKWALEAEAELGLDDFGRPAGFKYWFTPENWKEQAWRINPLGWRATGACIELMDRLR